MSAQKKNPWDDFKPITTSSRPPSRNTPGRLLFALIFSAFIGFGIGAGATAFIIASDSDERRYMERRSNPTFVEENFRWFVLAGGVLGACSLMGTVWKYWPKDLD